MAINAVTKEVKGIEVSLDPRTFTDMRFIKLLTRLMALDGEKDEAEKSGDDAKLASVTMKMMDVLDDVAIRVFGSEESVEAYQDRVAAQNDGFLDFRDWLDFVMEIVTTYQKNS